jgi:hypothetical protein
VDLVKSESFIEEHGSSLEKARARLGLIETLEVLKRYGLL